MSDAWLFYAPPEKREEFSKPIKFPEPEQDFGSMPLAGRIIGAIGQVLSVSHAHAEHRANLKDELREDLLDRLFQGELVAFGFRPSSRTPQRISQEFFFDAEVDWEGDSAKTSSTQYLSIRVLFASASPRKANKRMGRSPADPQILEAIAICRSRYPRFPTQEMRFALKKVQSVLLDLDPTYATDKKNRSDKTIEKYILLDREANKT